MSSNVGKQFLAIIDKHFGKERKDGLHKIFNRKTIKISYSCTKNMKNILAASNAKKLDKKSNSNPNTNLQPKCNCRQKNECPLKGNCVGNTVVYEATVFTKTETKNTLVVWKGPLRDVIITIIKTLEISRGDILQHSQTTFGHKN